MPRPLVQVLPTIGWFFCDVTRIDPADRLGLIAHRAEIRKAILTIAAVVVVLAT